MGGLVLFRTAEVAVNKGVTVGLTDCEAILMCKSHKSHGFSACVREVEAAKRGAWVRKRCAGGGLEVGGRMRVCECGTARRRPAEKLARVPCEIFA